MQNLILNLWDRHLKKSILLTCWQFFWKESTAYVKLQKFASKSLPSLPQDRIRCWGYHPRPTISRTYHRYSKSKDYKRDKDLLQGLFLLSSTGQIENFAGHLFGQSVTIKLTHVFMVAGLWGTVVFFINNAKFLWGETIGSMGYHEQKQSSKQEST